MKIKLIKEELIVGQDALWPDRDRGPWRDDLDWVITIAKEAEYDVWKIAEFKQDLSRKIAKAHGDLDFIRKEQPHDASGQRQAHWACQRLSGRKKALKLYLAMMWAKPLGLRLTGPHRQIWTRIMGSVDQFGNVIGSVGLFDHNYFWRSGKGIIRRHEKFVITTHPYNVADKYRKDAACLCEEVGAIVEYPEFPSWWNWSPGNGGTTLVVWSAAPDAEAIRRRWREAQREPKPAALSKPNLVCA